MEVSSKISRTITVVAITAGILLGVFSILNVLLKILGAPIDIEYQLSFFILLLSCVLAYVFKAIEEIKKQVESLKLQSQSPPVSVFRTPEEFFLALRQTSIEAEEIYTCMLSDPPDRLGKHAIEYFESVDKKIADRKNGFKTFRRIATVFSPEKAKWILEILLRHKYHGNFSLAIQYVDEGYPQTSFHVAYSAQSQTVFVWETVVSGDFGKGGFVLQDANAAKVMIEEHQRSFMDSKVLKRGSYIDWKEITALAEKYDLTDTDVFRELIGNDGVE